MYRAPVWQLAGPTSYSWEVSALTYENHAIHLPLPMCHDFLVIFGDFGVAVRCCHAACIWYHLPIGIMVIGHQNIGGHKKVKANRTLKLIMKKVVASVEAKCKNGEWRTKRKCWLPLLTVAINFWLPLLVEAIANVPLKRNLCCCCCWWWWWYWWWIH